MYPITKGALDYLCNNGNKVIDGKYTYVNDVRFHSDRFATVFATVKDMVNVKCNEHPARNFLLDRLNTLRGRTREERRMLNSLTKDYDELEKKVATMTEELKVLTDKANKASIPQHFDRCMVVPAISSFGYDTIEKAYLDKYDFEERIMANWFVGQKLDICSAYLQVRNDGNLVYSFKAVPASAATMNDYDHIHMLVVVDNNYNVINYND